MHVFAVMELNKHIYLALHSPKTYSVSTYFQWPVNKQTWTFSSQPIFLKWNFIKKNPQVKGVGLTIRKQKESQTETT